MILQQQFRRTSYWASTMHIVGAKPLYSVPSLGFSKPVKEKSQQVKSIYDKLDDYRVTKDGMVIHNLFPIKDENGKTAARKFKDLETFEKWKSQRIRRIKDQIKGRLTPHQYHVTQNKGTERAFTGDYWWVQDVGRYDCTVCS